ncbi:MBL fold metallo-hydrolase [Candidatus Parcubacteria bacterium]|nr:MAG: MBL fold metallo-hydrolase [Candidatus Parcubacteria bacterium]
MANFKKHFKYYFILFLFLSAAFVWLAVYLETRKNLLVAFLDVGQGDAVFIQAPNGNQILVDGGPNKAILRELSKVMPFYDRTIDGIILTHPHLDHYAGLMEAARKYDINFEMDPGVKTEGEAFALFEDVLREKGLRRIYGKRGMRLVLDKDIYLEILLPAINNENLSEHDGMLVSRLVYGNNSFLLTGDMEENLEEYLIATGAAIGSDVLKVAHHGSKTSSSEKFLGWVSPDLAVISVGKNNKYGHPHEEVTGRLEKFEIPILRTNESKTIKIKSDGEKIFVQ